jgi:hypothetical protein
MKYRYPFPGKIDCPPHDWDAAKDSLGRLHSICLACGRIRAWSKLSRGEKMHALFNGEKFRRALDIPRDPYLTAEDRRRADKIQVNRQGP